MPGLRRLGEVASSVDPRAINYDLACLIGQQTKLLQQIADDMAEIRKSATVGLTTLRIVPFALDGDGSIQKIVEADLQLRPRRVLVVVESRDGVGDAVLAIGTSPAVSPGAGPIFATGTSHDLGILPADAELYASQLPVTGALASTMRLWVFLSI